MMHERMVIVVDPLAKDCNIIMNEVHEPLYLGACACRMLHQCV